MALGQLSKEDREVFQVIEQSLDWRTPYLAFFLNDKLSINLANEKKFKRIASYYTIFQDRLYRRDYTLPLLKCIGQDQASLVIAKVHVRACDNHLRGRSLAAKIL